MSNHELTTKINELRELRRLSEDLQNEIDALTDAIKNYMIEQNTEILTGSNWKITYKTVSSSRLDTSAIKRIYPEIAAQHTKTTETKRFVLA